MHLAVMSDIHGNLPALQAVLNDLQQYEIDGIIVAGDLVGGPQPVESIRLLRSLGSVMIRGNSDTGLLRYDSGEAPDHHYTRHQFALLRWSHRHIDRETLEFVRSLPEQRVIEIAKTKAIRLVHGSPRDPSESIFPDRDLTTLDLALSQIEEPVLVCGHTHIPWNLRRNDRLGLNPGAVAGPLNGQVGAQYALLSWRDGHWSVKHHTIPYDLERLRTASLGSGWSEEGGALARAFVLCLETGRNVFDDFFSYAFGLAAQAGLQNRDFVPDDIWDQATLTFHWDGYRDG